MKKFKHIVFTRQALYWGRVPMDNDVINYRLDLFEKTLLKSIQRQTDQNFTFVQLVSVQVDQAIKDRIKEYGEIVWVTEIGEHGPDAEALRRYIAKTVLDVDFVVTTNIDSDDMISKAYTSYINRYAQIYQGGDVILAPLNFYMISKHGFPHSGTWHRTSCPPLLSFFESNLSQLRTARYKNHNLILEEGFTGTYIPILKDVEAAYSVSEANIWRDDSRNKTIITPEIQAKFLYSFGLSQQDLTDLLIFLNGEKPEFIQRRKMYRNEV